MTLCAVCENEMNEGFLHQEAGEAYCSKKCLLDDGYTWKEYLLDHEEGIACWTTFDNEDCEG